MKYQRREAAGKKSSACILDLLSRAVRVFVRLLLKSQPFRPFFIARLLPFAALEANSLFKSSYFSLPSPSSSYMPLSQIFPKPLQCPWSSPSYAPQSFVPSFTAEAIISTSSQVSPLPGPLYPYTSQSLFIFELPNIFEVYMRSDFFFKEPCLSIHEIRGRKAYLNPKFCNNIWILGSFFPFYNDHSWDETEGQ